MIIKVKAKTIKEIKDWADRNNFTISRRMVYDILKESNKRILEEDIEKLCEYLTNEGYNILDEDVEDYESINDKCFIPADVRIASRYVSVDEMVFRLKSNTINLQPSYQRGIGEWSIGQKSRLIESLFLRIPLPSFYFDARNDYNWVVIDGLQRLSAIKEFVIDQSYKLYNLQYFREFENLSFDQLPPQYVRRILETQLIVYLVGKGTPTNVVFNIFQRLNTGGLSLSAQEIRQALNQGPVISVIERMGNSEDFKEATGYLIKSKRKISCEYATRYLAFTQLDIFEYNGSINDFLNKALEYGNTLSDYRLRDIEMHFYRDLDFCTKIFGNYAFRRISLNNKRGPINKAVFESVMTAISRMSTMELDWLVSNRDMVLEKYLEFMKNVDANIYKAGDKNTVIKRFEVTEDFVRGLLYVK